ncbi:MAG: DUF4058 family protein [Armatimonadota bacterium]|nr:DUF4058 family protein [bacterium]MDW8320967.1 DUF4058 family protein [Armatimonadota bacterium]
MEKRFVGMDPYIEEQLWEDFHNDMIVSIRAHLAPQLAPRYFAQIEERVYVEQVDQPADARKLFRHDVTIQTTGSHQLSGRGGEAVAVLEPQVLTLPETEEKREPYIAIVTLPARQVVTIIELLSPSNKNPESQGRQEYLRKRRQIIHSPVNLVEIDLLRKGARMPTVEQLPPGDYYAFVARGDRRPFVEVYSWQWNQPLPTIPIPLLPEDADAKLDLQEAFDTTFARARYEVRLDYSQPL